MYRRTSAVLQVFIVHPGGPYFRDRDEGCWSLPKGLIDPGEERLETACREFHEETGRTVEACTASATFETLGSVVQRGGKRVFAWAFEGEWPAGQAVESNTFWMEWAGDHIEVPEVDDGDFFDVEVARRKLNSAQVAFVDRLEELLGVFEELG